MSVAVAQHWRVQFGARVERMATRGRREERGSDPAVLVFLRSESKRCEMTPFWARDELIFGPVILSARITRASAPPPFQHLPPTRKRNPRRPFRGTNVRSPARSISQSRWVSLLFSDVIPSGFPQLASSCSPPTVSAPQPILHITPVSHDRRHSTRPDVIRQFWLPLGFAFALLPF